jgi:hypothetical protein
MPDIDAVAQSLGITARPGSAAPVQEQGRTDLPKAQDRVPSVADTTAQSLGITARPQGAVTAPEAPITGTVPVSSGGLGFRGQMLEGMPIVGPLALKATAALTSAVQGQSYEQSLARIKRENEAYAEANPVKALAGNLVGSAMLTIPAGGTTAGALALGLPNATRLGATVGGRLYGAIASQAGIGATDAALRGENPATGALVGGAGGGLGVLAGHTIGNIVQSLSKTLAKTPAALANVNAIGREWLSNALSNETEASLAAAKSRMGPQGFLADVNPQTTELAAGIANRAEPPASAAVGEAYRVRDAAQRQTIDKALTGSFGRKVDIEEFKNAITENRAAAADPLYKQWRSMEVQPTEELQKIVGRADKSGAVEEARYLGDVSDKPIDMKAPTPQTYDLIKRGLDSKIEQAYSAGNKTRAAALVGLKQELIDEVGKTPAGQVWNQARAEFADRSQLLDEIAKGQDTFLGSRSGLSVDELRHELQGLSGPERAARIVGARNAADEVMGASVRGDTTLRNKFLAPNNQEKLRLLIGDRRAKALVDTLEQQQYLSGQTKYVNPRAGSPTAPRTAAMNALEAPPLPEWNPNLTQPLSFIPPSWVEALRPSTILQGGRQAAYANARQQIVPALLSQGGHMNALLAAIGQEAVSRAAAGQRGAMAGRLATAALTGPGTEAARRRGKFSTNALVGGAQ